MPALKKQKQRARAKGAAKPSVSSLIAASRKGNVPKIKELILQGININAVAGGVALNCALGGAAEKSRLEVIRLLLEAGADPNNPLLPKHATFPLDWAVFAGSTDSVQLLLESGANPNRLGWDNQTALDSAKTYNNKPIIEILKKHGGMVGSEVAKVAMNRKPLFESSEDDETPAVNLTKEANIPKFSKFLQKLAKESSVTPEAIAAIRGGYSFTVSREQADRLLEQYFQEARDSGFLLFRATISVADGDHRLVLLPTSDNYIAVRGMQTSAANHDLSPTDIIRWLQALEKRQPFLLNGIGRDFLEGWFTSKPTNADELAKDIYEFCPDVVDQGTETVKRLAAELRKTKRLFLWWD